MIIIDPEFRDLIPPLSNEEFQQLEENCIRDGIRDFLTVWPQEDGTDILIDGHNRWRIIGRHPNRLCPNFKRIQFESREDAKEWIIKNQLGRRNIPAFVRAELALKLKPVIAERAKEKQASHTEQGYQKSDKAVHTTKELAKAAGVSHDTIHKVEVIEEKASDEEKQALRKGETSINQVYTGIVASENENRRQREARELREARHRAEDHETSDEKVVSFGDVKQHKDDNKLIFNDFKERVYQMQTAILKAANSTNEEIVLKAIGSADRSETIKLSNDLQVCHRILLKIQRIVIEAMDEK